MLRYAVRRVFGALIALFAVTVVTFVFLHLLPGNPAWALLGRQATPARAARLAAEMGLDLPLPLQYLRWVGLLLHGGGFASGFTLVMPTIEFVVSGGVAALVLALGIALLQERLRGSLVDHALGLVAYVFYTFPSFWLAIMLVYVFAFQVFWLPGSGPYGGPGSQGLGGWAYYMILPVTTLALTTVATWSTQFRSAIAQALRSDYVRTARAKGIEEGRVMTHHVLRNAMLPVVTIVGMSLPSMFNNVVVLEWVFNMRGLGSGLLGSLIGMNYGGAVDIIFVIGLITVAGSLLADFLYAFVDPRIQFN
jgi:peptide/nickel transport system permease protein